MKQFTHTLPMTVDAINLGMNRKTERTTTLTAMRAGKSYIKTKSGYEILFDEAPNLPIASYEFPTGYRSKFK